MRYICSEEAGICVYLVTQNEIVADRLCKLNAWQKIGPLNGLTTPSRQDVLQETEPIPHEDVATPWNLTALEQNRRRLTIILTIRYPETIFEKDDWTKEHDGLLYISS